MLQPYKNKTIASTRKISSGMIALLTNILFLLSSAQSMEYVVAPVIGATMKPYVNQALEAVQAWVETYPKTFENEFNEAVCGIDRGKLRQIITTSLSEFDKQVERCKKIKGGKGPVNYNIAVFANLGQGALTHLQKYELVLIMLDFIDHSKTLLDAKWKEAGKDLTETYDPRFLGETHAEQFSMSQQETTIKAQKIIHSWKMNLLAALHEKYFYKCEGGWLDRGARSYVRHHKRGNDWGIKATLLGTVSVPKRSDILNPFSLDDGSLEATLVRECNAVYDPTVKLIRAGLETQIGPDKLDYVARLKDLFKVLFPNEIPQSTDGLKKPQFLLDYIEFLRQQQAEKQKTEANE
ncbi:hypothetical protein [Candidatus Odyssella acanthamoebae]|uniref:Uncharacterized protein n=1 Tax=Candidatus Odyssella acanthamoebae TaxID=91604 RepID=A0A077AV66_9PROT|nr:hypothetical protein [Candidatus Paracaedibacter acanthamoebae]AIK95528.1 hypothetical protein ID47_00270 [Candidatus Paracaedibacter acanthamoebae]